MRKGFHHSEETKKKISKAHKGLTCSVETREKMSNSRKGKHHSEKEWKDLKKKYKYTCPKCKRKEPQIKLTADHIIPLSKGGSNYIENIQPLCHSCNSRKLIKIFKINPKGQYELCFTILND